VKNQDGERMRLVAAVEVINLTDIGVAYWLDADFPAQHCVI